MTEWIFTIALAGVGGLIFAVLMVIAIEVQVMKALTHFGVV